MPQNFRQFLRVEKMVVPVLLLHDVCQRRWPTVTYDEAKCDFVPNRFFYFLILLGDDVMLERDATVQGMRYVTRRTK
jgi:hypothetical protein